MAPDLRLWRVDLDRPTEWVEHAAATLLSSEERAHADVERTDVRRRRIVSRAALRIALARALGEDPAALRLVADRLGKPSLAGAGAGDLHFSVAHSGECCLIAVTALAPVGVDVEQVKPFDRLETLARRRFAPAEADAILALDGERRLSAFYRCWTCKEAYLKARGVGLTMPLGTVVVAPGHRPALVSLPDDDPAAWTLATIDVGEGLAGALAMRASRALPEAALAPETLAL